MHFTCRSFIGKTSPNWWSQYWENEPDDSIKITKGHLFGLINLSSDSQTDLKITGHDIITEINNLYFSQDSDNINQNLTSTLESISQNPIFSKHQLSLILAVVIGQKTFIATLGEGKIILQRGSQISQILSGLGNQVLTISGPIKNNDRLMLVSQNFFDQISWDKIKSFLLDQKIQNIEENFLATLYTFDDQNFLSSALIEIHQDQEESEIIEKNDPPIDPPQTAITPPNPVISPSQPNPVVTPPPQISLHSQPPIYVKNRLNFKVGQTKKTQLFIALFLLLGLGVSFVLGYRKNQTNKAENTFQTYKTELEKKLNNISVVKSLNLETAYKTAKEAQEIIQNMSKLNIHSDQISQYKSQVDAVLSQTGDSDTFNPEFVYDTSLILSQPKFSKIYFSKSTLYLLDSTNGRIDSILPKEKSTKNISLSDDLKSSQKLLFDNNNIYLFSKNQISLVEKTTLTSKLDFSTSPSVTVTDVQFWNGSVYIIDSSSQSIWKFTPSASGFSQPQSWLKNSAKLELGATSLSIDSRLWVLTQSGQINLYISGVKDNFKQNQSVNFTKASSLNAEVDSDFLIFSDDSKFIYVYKKTGDFVSKFNLSNLQVLDYTFDSAAKTIYFLASDQKIYKITL